MKRMVRFQRLLKVKRIILNGEFELEALPFQGFSTCIKCDSVPA